LFADVTNSQFQIIQRFKSNYLEKGVVIKSTGSWYTVKTGSGQIYNCRIRGNYRIKGIRATNPVAVGDFVDISHEENEITSIIENVHERKNYIIRRASNLSKEYQLIACNIDQAWIIACLNSPKTFLEFIDRFLVTAQAYSIPAAIIFNKTDIYTEREKKELLDLITIYEKIGYKCFAISAKQDLNLNILKKNLNGMTTLISGNSGVGKSTIINKLYPDVQLKTGDISSFHKTGKHTTTFAEMVELPDKTYLIDTPGIKGFGIVDFNREEISHFFPEIFAVSKNCQFSNCLHLHEPGCAVKKAVEEGTVPQFRFNSYLSIINEDEGRYRQTK
jgi:ribosome biogenesis GTPase / thiamine phosphate phosphatase